MNRYTLKHRLAQRGWRRNHGKWTYAPCADCRQPHEVGKLSRARICDVCCKLSASVQEPSADMTDSEWYWYELGRRRARQLEERQRVDAIIDRLKEEVVKGPTGRAIAYRRSVEDEDV